MSWLSGWQHRKTVTITGQAGAGTDYQVDFSIGEAAGGDFNLESHCTSFPNDIQITDNDQITPLDYWVEDLTVDPIRMWIEVADDLGSNVDICVYYDKSGEPTSSNGDNTFDFFEDFDGGANHNEVDPNHHITQDRVTDKRLEWTLLTRNEDAYVYADMGVDYFKDFEARVKFSPTGGAGRGLAYFIGFSNDVDDFSGWYAGNHKYITGKSFGTGYTSIVAYETSTENIDIHTTGSIADIRYIKITRESNEVKMYYYDDADFSNLIASGTITQSVSTQYRYIFLLNTYNDGYADRMHTGYSDTYRIRKLVLPEPAFSTAGAEESAPSVGAIMNQFQRSNLGADLYDGVLIT